MLANFTKVMGHDASTSDDAGSALSRLEFGQSEITLTTWKNVQMKFRLIDSLVVLPLDFQGSSWFLEVKYRADKHMTLLLVDHVPIVRSVLISIFRSPCLSLEKIKARKHREFIYPIVINSSAHSSCLPLQTPWPLWHLSLPVVPTFKTTFK